jgi:hypothetical protein
MDEAIVQYIKRKYNLLIGERTAEIIKKEIGSAYPLEEPVTVEVKGRDLVAGVPKTLLVNSDEIREALTEPVNAIVDAIRSVLERTPPQLERAEGSVSGAVHIGGSVARPAVETTLNLGDLTLLGERFARTIVDAQWQNSELRIIRFQAEHNAESGTPGRLNANGSVDISTRQYVFSMMGHGLRPPSSSSRPSRMSKPAPASRVCQTGLFQYIVLPPLRSCGDWCNLEE